jgi:RNA polymerase-binding transcription factor DksA
MVDPMDIVQQWMIDALDDALAGHRAATAPRHPFTGFCRDCGEPIDPERLAALADAVRCIDCQTRCERTPR